MAAEIDVQLTDHHRQLLRELAAFFASRGLESYATGGLIRDALLDVPTRDLDISIAADPLELGPALATVFEGHYFPLDEERRHARIRLPAHEVHIDLLPLRAGIEADLHTRDYTVNAMAAPLQALAHGHVTLIDPTGGLSDLRARIIRLVSEQALIDDPLRLLRGVRLATQLDFHVEPQTADLIRRHAALLSSVAVERQRDELMLLLSTQRAAQGLRLMDELTLLSRLLPELDATREVEQPKEHHFDVFGHSLEAVAALDMLLDEEPGADPAAGLWLELWDQLHWWIEARTQFRQEVLPGASRSAVLKLAGLLHEHRQA